MANINKRSALLILVLLTIFTRIIPALLIPNIADMPSAQFAGKIVLLGKNIYLSTDSYPYPPLYMWLLALDAFISQTLNMPFQIILKIPLIISDILVMFSIYKLAQYKQKASSFKLALIFALNPVVIIITGVHGQFDTLPILMALLAILSFKKTDYYKSAFLLGLGIALKGFPILLLPFFIINYRKSFRKKIIFALIALFPVFSLIIPYIIMSPNAVFNKVFAYSGVTDYGWIAIYRTFYWIQNNMAFKPVPLTDVFIQTSKILFIILYVLVLFRISRKKTNAPLIGFTAVVFCLFYVVYGGVSSQYLYWIVPFLILLNLKLSAYYSFFATFALVGFYTSAAHKIIINYFPTFTYYFADFLKLYLFSLILLFIFLTWLLIKLCGLQCD